MRDQVLATLAGSGLAAAIETAAGDDADARRLSNQLRGYRQRLEELDTARWTEGTISEAVYVRQGNALRDRIRRDERALAQRPRRRALVGLSAAHPSDLRGWWESADLDLRRSLVALLVEQVVVHPAVKGRNTFDPSRIEVVWTQ